MINFDFTNIKNIPFFDVSLQQIDFGVTGLMNGLNETNDCLSK